MNPELLYCSFLITERRGRSVVEEQLALLRYFIPSRFADTNEIRNHWCDLERQLVAGREHSFRLAALQIDVVIPRIELDSAGERGGAQLPDAARFKFGSRPNQRFHSHDVVALGHPVSEIGTDEPL